MAQQSARRGRKNQQVSVHFECGNLIWFRSANSHTGPQHHRCTRGRTDGSIRLRAHILQRIGLRFSGRPQMTLSSLLLGARSGDPRINLEDDLQPVLVVPLFAHFYEPILADKRQ